MVAILGYVERHIRMRRHHRAQAVNLSFRERIGLARRQRAADLINRRHPTEEFLNVENRGVHHRGIGLRGRT
jgi:hypothetical protein